MSTCRIQLVGRRAAVLVGLSVLFLSALACDSGSSTDLENCTLTAGPSSHNSALTVEYSAMVTGDAEITELTYTTNDGEQSVSSPANGWSQTVNVDGGVELEITADVEVSNGSAEIGYVGDDGAGFSVEESDNCSITAE